MINAKESIVNMLNSPVRRIGARAELFNGSALVSIFNHTDALKEFTIERVGDESKFFGFGVCQKLNVKLLDPERALNITTANTFEAAYGVGSDFIYCYPYFKVTEVHRDEKTNALSVTAYDAIHEATTHTFAELLGLGESYTLLDVATACASVLGLPLSVGADLLPAFALNNAHGANFEGTETLRAVLDDIAEATQTIYYINNNWALTFKRLDRDGDAVFTISKDKYFDLDSKTNRRLTGIVSATELGDNVSATTGQSGTTQYIRDNAFWELRDDIAELVENAVANVGGLAIAQFNCDNWRGNFLLEIGDKIELVTKDGERVTSYVLNDVITYNGFLSESTQWNYTDNNGESLDNPSTLGELLKQTYAKVDKQNKKIELAVQEVNGQKETVTALQMTTDNITANVTHTQSEMDALSKSVETKMSADDVSIVIKQEMASGVSSVVTEKGYTFSDEGLRISQSGSQMESLLDEDGLKVYRDGDEVLTADNTGVEAINVKVKTYLIVGANSRFEDYEGSRTGCFWIG